MARRKQRKGHEIEKEILDFVGSLTFPTTSTEIARSVRLNWGTAKKYLDKLKGEGRLNVKRVGRQNQWWIGDVYEQKKLAEKTPELEKRILELENTVIELKKENLEFREELKKFKN